MQIIFRVNNARRRAALLGSTAFLAAAAALPAHAQDAAPAGPVADRNEPVRINTELGAGLLDTPYTAPQPQAGAPRIGMAPALPGPYTVPADALIAPVEPDPQIVISNPGTSTTSRDTGVTGVGQMVVDQQNGFIGLCTGTLINPRTVLFAAHCVNSRAATAYGANSGGVPISFGFDANNLPALQRWFNATIGGQPNPQRYQSNPGLFLYNVNQVRYNNLSLEPASRGFLYGDIATATLDTPASNVPLWAMLFSPLPARPITAEGTGYNVGIVGYGGHGNATTGSASGSDFRRRIAENVLGALTDLRTFERFLFGSSNSPTQNLYFIDFDDPRRGLTGASPFDFNAFRDNARGRTLANPTEGITAAGDSGSPLALQNIFTLQNMQMAIGVLSGGYTRFFNGQPANGYGTVSFYQPIFLYWDWIAANNPYRYVTNLGGDRDWTDPANWITTLDPSYQIIGPSGQLVNGIPNDLGLQKNGTGNGFGEICFDTRTISDCQDVATGSRRVQPVPQDPDEELRADNNAASEDADRITKAVTGWAEAPVPEAQADGSGATNQALPPATIANGLPGAINFVPNNADPVRTTGAIGRYFDVTLNAAGTTSLNSAVTIDRLRLTGSGTRLNINGNGSLTSLIDVTQVAGVMRVDGTLTSRGDFLLMGGGLMGSGRINAPFTTNFAATITPGTDTTIGTLTFGGNLVLSSGSQLFINTAGNGVSDLVQVVATTFNAQNQPTNGRATLGGRVTLSRVPGTPLRFNDLYTILTAQGGIAGTFSSGTISIILRPEFIYNSNSVQVRVTAVPYASVVNTNSSVQTTYASLLDRNRGNAALNGIFDILDFAPDAATIQSTLENLAPRAEPLRGAIGIVSLDNSSRLTRDRLNSLQPGDLGGRLSFIGKRVQTAALSLSGLDGANATMSDVSVQPDVREAALPEDMSAFVAAGYLDGESDPLAGTLAPFARDQFDGFYFSAGIEHEMEDRGIVGFALTFTDLEGTTGVGGQSAEGRLYQGTLYGKQNYGPVYVDAQFSFGLLETDTQRAGNLPGQAITLRSEDNALALAGEVGVGAMFGDSIRFGPRGALRTAYIDGTNVAETGGVTALVIDRPDYRSIQGRAGVVVDGVGRIRPNASATYVHEFEDQPAGFGANFVGGVGGFALFPFSGRDSDWFEVGGGLTFETGRVELSVSADTTLERDDVENQSYRAAVKFRF